MSVDVGALKAEYDQAQAAWTAIPGDRPTAERGAAWLRVLTAYDALVAAGVAPEDDEQKQTYNVTNRVYWQNEFNSLSQNIATYQAQIATAHANEVAHPNDSFYEQNLAGLVQECDLAVGQYNADAAKPIASPWLPAGLPTSYDRTTACGG